MREYGARRRAMGNANFADIMNAPTGTGFENRPRGVETVLPSGEVDTRLSNYKPAPEANVQSAENARLKEIFSTGEVKGTEPLGGGANASVQAIFEFSTKENNWQGLTAVYKPESGETWETSFANPEIRDYITNKDFSLAAREAFAYEVGDKLFGPDNPVPVTVLREEAGVSVDSDDDDGGGDYYDSNDAREQYDEYREKAQENAHEAVGEEFGNLYLEAQQEHADAIKARADEMEDIWNDLIEKEFPETDIEHDEFDAQVKAQQAHPTLPMGSAEPFERRDPPVLDPMEVLAEAGIDVDRKLSEKDQEHVRAVLRKHLQEGVQLLGEVNERDAREDLDRDEWYDNHQDTEMRLYESKIQSFDSWKQSKYGDMDGGGGGGARRNDDAPHPNGGSFQHFREMSGSGSFKGEHGVRLAVLDYALGSMDRHGSNIGWDEEGRPMAIDNGYSMPDATGTGIQFRSVPVKEWLNGSARVPEALSTVIRKTLEDTDWKALTHGTGMNGDERDAFLSRIRDLKQALRTDTGLAELWRQQTLMGSW